jgi:hypothetical protein
MLSFRPSQSSETINRREKMPIAIHTKYLGPSNVKGARIKATIRRDNKTFWTATIPFDHALDCEARHALAAKAVLQKHSPALLNEIMSCAGSTLDNLGYVFTVYPQTV